MSHLLLQAEARKLPIRTGSVQACITSPPYFALRDYGVPGQIGLEASPDEYVAAMVTVFREVKRVLRDDGCAWLNLGDSYSATRWSNTPSTTGISRKCADVVVEKNTSLPAKNLILIPERVALALQADGWVIRAKPPWIKPSPMPESVTDRPTTAHETIWLMTKRADYFFDSDAVRSDPTAKPQRRLSINRSLAPDRGQADRGLRDGCLRDYVAHDCPEAGRNRRTSDWFNESLDEAIAYHEWQAAELRRVRAKGGMMVAACDGTPLALRVASESFSGSHFATFPRRLVEPMVRASTSEAGCCPACGKCWERETEKQRGPVAEVFNPKNVAKIAMGLHSKKTGLAQPGWRKHPVAGSITLGWHPACRCDAGPPVPCVVADIFNGAGTTGVVSLALGRRYIGCDLSRDYLEMSRRRIERPHAKLPRPARVEAMTNGQRTLEFS